MIGKMYELNLILLPGTSKDDAAKVLKQITQWIGKTGSLEGIDHRGKMPLSYPIQKQSEGYFIFADVTAEPASAQELNKKLQLSDAVLRHMLVKKEKAPRVKKERKKESKSSPIKKKEKK